METALKAIAEPRRQAILRLVRDEELSAGEIASHFDVTRPAVSQHLTVLKEAGLVDERRNGTRRLYRARPEGLADLKAFLDEFWDESGSRPSNAKLNERRTRSMESTTDQISVTREVRIEASPETVWEFLVDPEKIRRWKGELGTFDARPGGGYRIVVSLGHVAAGEIVEVDRPRRLVYTWGWEGEDHVPPGSTTIEYELVPEGAGTRLRFVHRDLPSAEAAKSHAQGWDHYFERLQVAAGGGDPGPDPWVTERSE